MKRYVLTTSKKQKGAATLVTAVILLIAITLVALLSGKTVLNETKIAASNYRITQASAAANYAMDLGFNYFDSGGFDRLNNTTGLPQAYGDGIMDTVGDIDGDGVNDSLLDANADGFFDAVFNLSSSDGSQSTSAQLSFNNAAGTRCVAAGESINMKKGLITAVGFSDDGLATRTITQCVGPLNILHNDGPKQPLIAQGNVALTGNARIINRFTNTTIWSGGQVGIGSSSAMETYILDPAVVVPLDPSVPADKARLLDTDENADTQLVSNNNLGNGLDIIDDDPSLGTLEGLAFFTNFFTVDTRAELKALAGDQVYTSMGDAITVPAKKGLIWVEEADGDQTMNGGTIGSTDEPAIVYINGDFTLGGTATIYGLLYVAGKYTIVGTPTVVGANIVEGTDLATETPTTPPIVSGVGTISLVYWQGFFSAGSNVPPGLGVVIAGSWRDW